jgi:hypothetical protein
MIHEIIHIFLERIECLQVSQMVWGIDIFSSIGTSGKSSSSFCQLWRIKIIRGGKVK